MSLPVTNAAVLFIDHFNGIAIEPSGDARRPGHR